MFNGWRWAQGSLKSHSPAKFPGSRACWLQLDAQPQPAPAPRLLMTACSARSLSPLFLPFPLDPASLPGDCPPPPQMGACCCLPTWSPGVCHSRGHGAASKPSLPHGRAGRAASLLPFSVVKPQATQKGFSSDTCTEVTNPGLTCRKSGVTGFT